MGDLQLHPDGMADGWCWAPRRPRARLAFDILVDDRVVAGGEAALPRPDLAAHGMRDTRHGFRLALPPDAIDRNAACLISARARGSMVVFGRRMIEPARPPAPEPREAALQAELGALSQRLARLAVRPRATPRDARLREAAGVLAAALPAHAPGQGGAAGGAIEAARRVLAAAIPPFVLPRPTDPAASLLLRASGDVAATAARLRDLAPAAHAIGAEVLLLDGGVDARHALLPSLIPGLILARPPSGAWDAAPATMARGEWLLLLDDGPVSATGLIAVLASVRGQAIEMAVAPGVRGTAGLPLLATGMRSGLRLAIRRSSVIAGDDLVTALARLRGRAASCAMLAEPWPTVA